jgi:MoxR-like ATPase
LDAIENEEKTKVKKVFWPKEFIKLKDKINKVVVSDEMKKYITRLISKTREKNSNLIYGASPRWSIWLMNASRALSFIEWKEFVSHQEIQRVALSVLRHRVVLSYNAKINWITEDEILLDLFKEVELG